MHPSTPDLISFGGRPFSAPAGTRLFGPGDHCQGFLWLTAGRIRVTMVSEGGREIVLYRVSPGEVCLQTFACLAQRRPYSADGVVENDLAGVLLPLEGYQAALATSPEFRDVVMSSVARRFGEFEDLVSAVAFLPFEARLARALLTLADGERVMATHEVLAQEAASSRAVVSRQLGRWSHMGLVAVERGCIRLLDAHQLGRVARW